MFVGCIAVASITLAGTWGRRTESAECADHEMDGSRRALPLLSALLVHRPLMGDQRRGMVDRRRQGAKSIGVLSWRSVMGTILLVVLILLLVGALSTWPHSANWGVCAKRRARFGCLDSGDSGADRAALVGQRY